MQVPPLALFMPVENVNLFGINRFQITNKNTICFKIKTIVSILQGIWYEKFAFQKMRGLCTKIIL